MPSDDSFDPHHGDRSVGLAADTTTGIDTGSGRQHSKRKVPRSFDLTNDRLSNLKRQRNLGEENGTHEDVEGVDSQDAHAQYVTSGSGGASLHMDGNTLEAGRDINVAVTAWHIKTSDKDREIAEWFFNIDYRAMHNEVKVKRSQNTGGWFLQTEAFTKWCASTDKRFLWCPGIPGVGKTVMASLVVDHLRMLDENKTFVGIIYFRYNLRNQQSKLGIFKALCRQMYEIHKDDRFKSVFEDHEKHKSLPTDVEIKKALSAAFQRYQTCYLILDALDEYTAGYSDKGVRELADEILKLGSNVKLLITSRNLGDMEANFKELGAIRQEISGNDGDLRAYVDENVKRLKSESDLSVSDDLSMCIIEKVMGAAKGRFLIAELSMQLLAGKLSLGELEDALEDLPNEVDETYMRVMELIQGYHESHRKLAMKALMWVAFARRPLTVGDLQHALATGPCVKSGKRRGTDGYVTPLSMITSLCAGLIVVQAKQWGSQRDDSRIVQFVHFTTQEFFENSQLENFSNAHKEMFSTCIDYLSISAIHSFPADFKWSSDSFYHPFKRSSYLPFYGYSAVNWGYHASSHHEALHNAVAEFLSESGQTQDLALEYLLLHDCNDITETGVSNILLAAYHNQVDVLHLLLGQLGTIPCTKKSRSPLHVAVIQGWKKAAEAMIQWLPSQYTNQHSQMFDLCVAKGGNLIVELPGKKAIDIMIDMKDSSGQTALSHAAQRGMESVVRLLLEHGDVDVNSKDNYGRTPLSHAAEQGHGSVIKLLLEHGGVDIDSMDDNRRTPLSHAAERGHGSVIKLLLEHGGVDVNSKDNYDQTPLSFAVEQGHNEAVKLLLTHRDIDINSKDNHGQTPLSHAAGRGQESVIKLLLGHGGVDVNSKDNHGRTPLSYAAADWWNGYQVVKHLLRHKDIDVNLKDKLGRTPLSYVPSSRQCLSTADLLHAHGALK